MRIETLSFTRAECAALADVARKIPTEHYATWKLSPRDVLNLDTVAKLAPTPLRLPKDESIVVTAWRLCAGTGPHDDAITHSLGIGKRTCDVLLNLNADIEPVAELRGW